ncbi:MAG: DUF3683 domain-containing protein, partial [Rubrivivax sp.]
MNAPLPLQVAGGAVVVAPVDADEGAPRLREIPYNYTSFSDREIVIRLLGACVCASRPSGRRTAQSPER